MSRENLIELMMIMKNLAAKKNPRGDGAFCLQLFMYAAIATTNMKRSEVEVRCSSISIYYNF